MRLYNLTAEENKLVSQIINDLTKKYKTHSMTNGYGRWANCGIQMVRTRAKNRGLLLDDVDSMPPIKDIKAIVKDVEV